MSYINEYINAQKSYVRIMLIFSRYFASYDTMTITIDSSSTILYCNDFNAHLLLSDFCSVQIIMHIALKSLICLKVDIKLNSNWNIFDVYT